MLHQEPEIKRYFLNRVNIIENPANLGVMLTCDIIGETVSQLKNSPGTDKQKAIVAVRDSWHTLANQLEKFLQAFETTKSRFEANPESCIKPWLDLRKSEQAKLLEKLFLLELETIVLRDRSQDRHYDGLFGSIKSSIHRSNGLEKDCTTTTKAKKIEYQIEMLKSELKTLINEEEKILASIQNVSAYFHRL